MSYQLLNTLYVQTPDAYVHLDHDTLRITAGEKELLRVPIHHIGSVVLFGGAAMSPQAMERCIDESRQVTFLDFAGRFRCRVEGPASGNVLLRLAQQEAYHDADRRLHVARRTAGAKIQNSRLTLLRGARDAGQADQRRRLEQAAERLAEELQKLPGAATLEAVRGIEGEAGAWYFGAFGALITVKADEFAFTVRTRRPPRDRMNALLSFLYALLQHDCAAAIEGVGLDSQIGFLHAVRPGRPALALDLMEEFRSGLVDRLALTLVNRRQLQPKHFDVRTGAGESVLLNDEGRKVVIVAYQKRKQEMTHHRLARQMLPLGVVPHLQARLLARHLRGEIAHYPPFLFGARSGAPRKR